MTYFTFWLEHKQEDDLYHWEVQRDDVIPAKGRNLSWKKHAGY